VTLQEPTNQPSVDLDGPDTQVMIAPSLPSPVFVDSTGRRSRLLRRFAYGFVVVCMVYGGLVSVSLAGGPVSTNAILPLIPDSAGSGADNLAKPSPIPEPSTKSPAATPKATVVDAQPPRLGPTHTLERAVVPKSPTPTPKKTTKAPKTTPPTTKPTSRPVESATTTPPTSTPPTTPPTSAPTSKAAAPKPPAATATGTGGVGGGEEMEPDDVAEPSESAATPEPTPDPTVTGAESPEDEPSEVEPTQDEQDAEPTVIAESGGAEESE
jgi:hypothetical protein